MTIKCGSCRFFTETKTAHPHFGFCHRFPPTIKPSGDRLNEKFPMVHEDMWCGEFQPSALAEVEDNK